ncbi:nucleotidyltransferase family protein [Alteromonas sp. ASW11-36]|uniref:Nucleotidyltransferase family protein n=1 Tax=Alteromonas arenosi TaxID=3055817 RepID=A0ABT7SXT1_9ALTE|nr:nucleotidyltransferase family protein [Alteromonas sp. ASW11-36]MDM7860970.1 nucleotidyltransferase family protein [Alteromonas sp. ASW11-36]
MKTSVAVLAAGESSRFDGIKQLAMVGQCTMLSQVLSQVRQLNVAHMQVCLGAYFDEIASTVPADFNIIQVDKWQDGLSASLHQAVHACPANCSHLLIVLADQISVTSHHLELLLSKAVQLPESIVCAKLPSVNSVPAIFPRKYFTQLLACSGDKGARQILNGKASVSTIDLPQAAIDIDTRTELAAFLKTKS